MELIILIFVWVIIASFVLLYHFSFRQFMYLGLEYHYSLTVKIQHRRWSGACGSFTIFCLLQFMATFCFCDSQNGERSCLVSLLSNPFYHCSTGSTRLQLGISFLFAARPAFYNYIVAMFVINAVALFSCGLVGSGAGFGLWYNPY